MTFDFIQASAMQEKDISEVKPISRFTMLYPELKQEIFNFVTDQHKKPPAILIQGTHVLQNLINLELVSRDFRRQTKKLREKARQHQYIANVQTRAAKILDKMAQRQDVYDYMIFPRNDRYFTDDVLLLIEQEIGERHSGLWRPLSCLNLINYPLLTDEGIASIGRIWDITTLRCANCPGIQGIGLQNFSMLNRLILEGCLNLTDDGFSSIFYITTLRSINLKSCPKITNGCLQFICKMENIIKLLSIESCPGITDNMLLFFSDIYRPIFIISNHKEFHLGRLRNRIHYR